MGELSPDIVPQITKDFTGIILCRVFIGLPEAAFYPGAIFLLSRWYTKKVIIEYTRDVKA
jgi:MFS family permease